MSPKETNKLIVVLTSEQKQHHADLERQRYYEKYAPPAELVPDINRFQPLLFTVGQRAIAWQVVRDRKLAQGIEYPVEQPASPNDAPFTPTEDAFVERVCWALDGYLFGIRGFKGDYKLLTPDMGRWFARCSQHTRDMSLSAFHVHEVIGAYRNCSHPLTYRQLDARYFNAMELKLEHECVRRNREQRAFKASTYYDEHKKEISESRAVVYQANKHIKVRCDDCGAQYRKTAWSNHKKSKTHRVAMGTYGR